MRWVDRNAVPYPEVFKSPAFQNSYQEIVNYFSMDSNWRSQERFRLDLKLLHDSLLAKSLSTLFLGKCAFCETPLPNEGHFVDHFRPASNAKLRPHRREDHDLYVWFAYEWNNLFAVCKRCNIAKQTAFPIQGKPAPLLCTWEEANRIEKPLLINPCLDNPERHLSLERYGELHPQSRSGDETLQCLDLNREDLVRARAERVDRFRFGLHHALRDPDGFEAFLRGFIAAEEPYAGSMLGLIRRFAKTVANRMGVSLRNFPRITEPLWRLLSRLPEQELEDLLVDSFYSKSDKIRSAFYPEPEAMGSDLEWEQKQSQAGHHLMRYESRYLPPLRKVSIRAFKGIQNLELEFPESTSNFSNAPCLAILGENAAGKTSVLQAIALCLMESSLRKHFVTNIQQFIPRNRVGWQFQLGQKPQVDVQFGEDWHARLEIDALEPSYGSDNQTSMLLLAYGARRYHNPDRVQKRALAAVESLFNPLAFAATPMPWLAKLDQRNFDIVARAVKEVLVMDPSDRLERDEEGRIHVQAQGRLTPIDHMSEGYQAAFIMTVDIIRWALERWSNLEEAQGIVLIDELETHLHPRWKMRIATALRSAFPRMQFIVTTHDPLCLNGFDSEEVVVLYHDPNRGVTRMTGLPSLQGLRSEQILTSDYFGLSSTLPERFEDEFGRFCELFKNPETVLENEEFEQLRRKFSGALVIGDDALQNIINQALHTYLSTRGQETSPVVASEKAVERILALLDEDDGRRAGQ